MQPKKLMGSIRLSNRLRSGFGVVVMLTCFNPVPSAAQVSPTFRSQPRAVIETPDQPFYEGTATVIEMPTLTIHAPEPVHMTLPTLTLAVEEPLEIEVPILTINAPQRLEIALPTLSIKTPEPVFIATPTLNIVSPTDIVVAVPTLSLRTVESISIATPTLSIVSPLERAISLPTLSLNIEDDNEDESNPAVEGDDWVSVIPNKDHAQANVCVGRFSMVMGMGVAGGSMRVGRQMTTSAKVTSENCGRSLIVESQGQRFEADLLTSQPNEYEAVLNAEDGVERVINLTCSKGGDLQGSLVASDSNLRIERSMMLEYLDGREVALSGC